MVSLGSRWVRSSLSAHDLAVGCGAVLHVETPSGPYHEDCSLLSGV